MSILLPAGCIPFEKPVDGILIPDKETYNIGDSVTVYCRNGFDLIGDETLACLNTGSWLGEIPTCEVPDGKLLTFSV